MSMQTVTLRLGELISARICHDLSGLAGALVGTLQLAEEGARRLRSRAKPLLIFPNGSSCCERYSARPLNR